MRVRAEILWLCKQLSEWLVSDNPAGDEAGCGGPGLAWLHVVFNSATRAFGRSGTDVGKLGLAGS